MARTLPDALFAGPPLAGGDNRVTLPRRVRRRTPDAQKRPDLQGLRALAVVAVVANHVGGWPRGGFVGVDVFFVLSGYLITGRLLRVAGTGNTVRHLLNFYALRVRRILPAAIVVIIATSIAAHFALGSARAHQTLVDGGWSAVFWANWHLIALDTNYFTAGTPVSPLQHYWSLSVEEQFYLLWPVVVLASAMVVSARARRAAITVAAVAVCVVSIGWGFEQSGSNAITAYFSTFTRGWELGAGALLACVLPRLHWTNRRLQSALSMLGLLVIVASLFAITPGGRFPVPGALAPVVGSMLVIAAGAGARVHNGALTNRTAVFVGDISYSVYLVHFPVIVLLGAHLPKDGYYHATALALSFGLAVLCWACVEQPVLNSRWLVARAPRPGQSRRLRPPGRTLLIGIAATVVGLGTLAAWPGNQAADDQRYAQVTTDVGRPVVRPTAPMQARLSKQITAALAATRWPRLSPSLAATVAAPVAPADVIACAGTTLGPARKCTWGSAHATHHIVLAGDSVAMVYLEALRKIVRANPGWDVRLVAAAGCEFSSRTMLNADKALQDNCAAHNQQAVAAIRSVRPDVLLVSNSTLVNKLADGAVLTDKQWSADLQIELAKVTSAVGRIAIVEPPPTASGIATCSTGRAPAACASKVIAQWQSRFAVDQSAAARRKQVVLDSAPWFCADNDYCPAFVGTTVTMHDTAHPASAYLDRIWPVIAEAMQESKLLR